MNVKSVDKFMDIKSYTDPKDDKWVDPYSIGPTHPTDADISSWKSLRREYK